MALDMAFKFYTSVAKVLRLKVRKLLLLLLLLFFLFGGGGLIPTFVEFAWEKLVGGFLPHHE